MSELKYQYTRARPVELPKRRQPEAVGGQLSYSYTRAANGIHHRTYTRSGHRMPWHELWSEEAAEAALMAEGQE